MHFPLKPETLLALHGTKSITKFTFDLMNTIYTREFMRIHHLKTRRVFKPIERHRSKILYLFY